MKFREFAPLIFICGIILLISQISRIGFSDFFNPINLKKLFLPLVTIVISVMVIIKNKNKTN